ncbi:MAG: sensor histidine kinase [Gaiellaceae bacterium]
MERRLLPPRSDVALGVVVAVLVALEVSLNDAIEPKAAAATAVAAAVALAWRRSLPLLTAGAVGASVAVAALLGVPIEQPVMPLISILVASYSLSVHSRLDRALAGLALLLSADAVAVTSQDKGLGNFVFALVFIAGAWATGQVVRARTARIGELEVLAEQRERAAAADERRRIARELHDVIAHSLSVMVVQAGAAEQVLRADPDRALEPLRVVQETGRRALSEMSRLLGVLREHGEELGLAPQPGLDDLAALVEEARATGLPVELDTEGTRRSLPLGVELSAYRIVQEALTNARKHAGEARARVTLRYGEDALEVEVVDDGRGGGQSRDGGCGLVGMRERVALYGGSLEAGARPGGGFGVRARLPLTEPS